MSLKHLFSLLPLALALAGANSFAGEACPYSLVRSQGAEGERIVLVTGSNLSPTDAPVAVGHDITTLIDGLVKTRTLANANPAAARLEVFFSAAAQNQIAAWACEAASLESFPENHAGVALVSVTAADALPAETSLNSGKSVESLSPRGALPPGIAFLLRAPVLAGQEVGDQNLADYVAGALLGGRFIPLQFLGDEDTVIRVSAARILTSVARRGSLAAGDLVRTQD